MAKEMLSIDFGEAFIAIAVGKVKKDTLVINKLQIIPTPEGAIAEERLQSSESVNILKECLKRELFQKNKNLFKRNVAISMGNSNTINRQIMLPSIQGGNLASVIKYEMEGYLPTGSGDYIIRYNILEEIEDEERFKRLRVFVGAAPKKTVEAFYGLAKSVGVNPIAMDMQCNSAQKLYNLCSIINDVEVGQFKTVALVDMGFSSISVNIVREGSLEQSGVIRFGGKQIRNAVASVFDYSDAEAEAQIDKHGCLEPKIRKSEDTLASDEEKYIDAFNDILRNNIDNCTEEMRKVFTYYSSRNIGYEIEHIFIYGYITQLEGITSYLSDGLNTPVTRMEKIDCIKLDKNLEKFSGTFPFDVSLFINALGALVQE